MRITEFMTIARAADRRKIGALPGKPDDEDRQNVKENKDWVQFRLVAGAGA